MKCEICHKNNASVHLTEIVNDSVTELHICEECAQAKGTQLEQNFDFADLLAGLSEFGGIDGAIGKVSSGLPKQQVCQFCGMTYEQFKKTGRFGCAGCYSQFKANIVPLLKRVHGSSQHLGKIPGGTLKEVQTMEKIKELKFKLEKAVEVEDFESAAKIRDEIKSIERGNSKI